MKTPTINMRLLNPILAIFLICSCVNKEYDLNNIDKTINVGGENLSIPLGSTDSIKVMSLLNPEDLEILHKVGDDYILKLENTIDFSESIPSFENINIEGIPIDRTEFYTVESIKTDDFIIEQNTITNKFNANLGSIDLKNLDLPEITETKDIDPDIFDGFNLNLEDLKLSLAPLSLTKENLLNLSAIEIAALKILSQNSSGNITTPAGASHSEPIVKISKDIEIELKLPADITNIDNIKLNENCQMTVDIAVTNSVITTGSFNPNIIFDPSSIFILEDGSKTITINEPLSHNNSFTFSKTYPIKGLNINSKDTNTSDWTGNILKITRALFMEGSITMPGGAVIPFSKIDLINSMGISLTVRIKDLDVTSADLSIEPIPISLDDGFAILMTPTDLPPEISSIETVNFKDNSTIDFSFTKNNMVNLKGLNIKFDPLKITFPKEYTVEAAEGEGTVDANNTLTFNPVFKDDVATLRIKVKSLDLSKVPITNNSLSYESTFKYNTNLSVSGYISTLALADNPSLSMKVSSNLEFKNATVTTNNIEQIIDEEFIIDFTFDEVLDYGKLKVIPEGDPIISINIDLPEIGLKTIASPNGVKISLPKEFHFKDIDENLNYDKAGHSITLKGEIPKIIPLTVDTLFIAPETIGGISKISATVEINGGIIFESGQTSSAEIASGLTNASFKINIPRIVPKTILTDKSFFLDVNENFDIPINIAKIEHVESIKSISLKNAKIDLSINLKALSSFGNPPVSVNLKIKFPERFVFSDPRIDEGNSMDLKGTFEGENRTLTIDPIYVSGLNLEDIKNISGGIDIDESISFTGTMEMDNPEVNVDTFEGAKIEVHIKGGISDFSPEKVIAAVKYEIEDINETLVIDDIPDFMRSKDFVLDVLNPYMILEVNTNIGIPIGGNIAITPWILKEEGGEKVNDLGILGFPIRLPFSSESKTATKKYWISETIPDVNDREEGVEYIEQPNLPNLIRTLPSSLVVTMDAETIIDKDGDDNINNHHVDFDTKYTANLKYELVVPLMFGDELNINFTDTIADIPSILTDLIKNGGASLFGKIENSLPLQLELSIEGIDADDNSTLLTTGSSTIDSCISEDEPWISSSFEIKLDENTNIKDIKSLKLVFGITSPNTLGIPITDDSYIKADLKVKIPNGITVDLDDLGDESEE